MKLRIRFALFLLCFLFSPLLSAGGPLKDVDRSCFRTTVGPEGETIRVPVPCETDDRTKRRKQLDATSVRQRADSKKSSKVKFRMPPGLYRLIAHPDDETIEIRFQKTLEGSDLRECDVISFEGDPKEIFGKALGEAIISASPSGRGVHSGILNRGGPQQINYCFQQLGQEQSLVGPCRGGSVEVASSQPMKGSFERGSIRALKGSGVLETGSEGAVQTSGSRGGDRALKRGVQPRTERGSALLKGGAVGQEVIFSEPCSDGVSTGCSDIQPPSGMGQGSASDQQRMAAFGLSKPGGGAMNEGGSTEVLSPVTVSGPGTQTYTTVTPYTQDGETLYDVQQATLDNAGGYRLAGVTRRADGSDVPDSGYSMAGNWITDDDPNDANIALRAASEATARAAASEDFPGSPVRGELTYNPTGRLWRPECSSAIGDDCGSGWSLIIPRPTLAERAGEGMALLVSDPQEPGEGVTDCRDPTGDSCGGAQGFGHPQPGVTLTELMMHAIPGGGAVDPWGPDDPNYGRTGAGGGPPRGGGICSPQAMRWVSTSEYSLDCDLRAYGGCDTPTSYNSYLQRQNERVRQQDLRLQPRSR